MKFHVNMDGRPDSSFAAVRDAELVRAAQGGDKAAFVEIVNRYKATVCGITLGILGNFAASEDAAQEAFLAAWLKIGDVREPEKLRSWLSQIARNTSLKLLRKNNSGSALEASPLIDAAPLPDQAAASAEEAAILQRCLAELPEKYRLPLILFYRENQSARAVAEALELSEDAVKQRLVRGREMLRERMSRLVENLLSRTRPSANFTASVAAALGALSIPGATAGAAIASASGSASFRTSLVPTMNASKVSALVCLSAGLLFVPAGYHFGARAFSAENMGAAPEASMNERQSDSVSSLTPLFAEWVALHDLYGRDEAAMPVLHDVILQMDDPIRARGFLSALIAEWVQVDARGGLRFFEAKGEKDHLKQYLAEWLRRDPSVAADALIEQSSKPDPAALELLGEVARLEPGRLPEVVSALPAGRVSDTRIRDAFTGLARKDLDQARMLAEAVHGPNRKEAFAGIAQAWGARDLGEAMAWVRTLKAEGEDELIRSALIGRATVSPGEALDLTGIVPPGGGHHNGNSTSVRVLRAAAESDFEGTLEWLRDHPGRYNQNEIRALGQTVAARLNADPAGFLGSLTGGGGLEMLLPAVESALINRAWGQNAAVWEWLRSQPDTEAIQKLKRSVLSAVAYKDPTAGMEMVRDLPQTSNHQDLLQMVADALLNRSYYFDFYEDLLRQAPPVLRPAMLEQAFNYLNGERLNEPETWVGRLAELPEDLRDKAAPKLAAAWAARDVEEAVEWVRTLPPGDSRTGSTAAVTASWAAREPRRAAEWVNSLPSGGERDSGAISLVESLHDRFPWEAWHWAIQIREPRNRERAAGQALSSLARQDKTFAVDLLESSPLTESEKARLRLSLQEAK